MNADTAKAFFGAFTIGPFMQVGFGLLLGYSVRSWFLRGETVKLSQVAIEFVRDQFDKLMLVFLVVFFMFYQMAMLMRFPNLDAATLQWMEKSSDMVLGALIVAVTTAINAARRGTSTPAPAPAPTVATATETPKGGNQNA